MFSDIDLFIVSQRNLTKSETKKLVNSLFSISGACNKSERRCIEATFVNINEIKPWTYSPVFDVKYGERLREEFEKGDSRNIELFQKGSDLIVYLETSVATQLERSQRISSELLIGSMKVLFDQL